MRIKKNNTESDLIMGDWVWAGAVFMGLILLTVAIVILGALGFLNNIW